MVLLIFAHQCQLADIESPCTLVITPAVAGMLKDARDIFEIVQFCQCDVRGERPIGLPRERCCTQLPVKIPNLMLAATQVQIDGRTERTEGTNVAKLHRNGLKIFLLERFYGVGVANLELARRERGNVRSQMGVLRRDRRAEPADKFPQIACRDRRLLRMKLWALLLIISNPENRVGYN